MDIFSHTAKCYNHHVVATIVSFLFRAGQVMYIMSITNVLLETAVTGKGLSITEGSYISASVVPLKGEIVSERSEDIQSRSSHLHSSQSSHLYNEP